MKVSDLRDWLDSLPEDMDVMVGYSTENTPRMEPVGEIFVSNKTVVIKTRSFQDFMESRYVGLSVLPQDTY
jgi:hypothetical protein